MELGQLFPDVALFNISGERSAGKIDFSDGKMLGPLGSALQDKGSPEETGRVEILRCV